ncbi:MAG: 4Fe-4S dicluster domain-containing protein [Deltaproteobacteria bacterium]|nr:4Fe-4S dicluster domain-containing protein [Deltaproteobacteria bacterium]MBW2619848.1 4Fe-4S dicluster domain-containing protein [Deltaproteobacteria bacterium]MBW2641875.1 4Fe-4S dicluster domain-containing protein [Deltaproteobacteria bacterium]
MQNIISDPDQARKHDSGKERKLIGDRGDYFLNRMEGETGANISACYQCERCTNSCPVSHFMDIKPHQVIHYVQLGWREELLKSSTIWICLSCEMCTTYCPNEVDVAEIINHLRNMAAHSSITPKEKSLAVFHQTFLEVLQKSGRVNEFRLMNAYYLKPDILHERIKNKALKEDLLLGITMLRKGRLKLFTPKSRAIKEIKRVYSQTRGEIV